MSDREHIIKAVEFFYEDIIEKYKELERKVVNESRILTIFKKVDYKGRIIQFKDFKKNAQKINLKNIKIDVQDDVSVEVKEKLEHCITVFCSTIDAQVVFHTMLLMKSEGKKIPVIDYKKTAYNVHQATDGMQNALRALDAVYANLEENE